MLKNKNFHFISTLTDANKTKKRSVTSEKVPMNKTGIFRQSCCSERSTCSWIKNGTTSNGCKSARKERKQLIKELCHQNGDGFSTRSYAHRILTIKMLK